MRTEIYYVLSILCVEIIIASAYIYFGFIFLCGVGYIGDGEILKCIFLLWIMFAFWLAYFPCIIYLFFGFLSTLYIVFPIKTRGGTCLCILCVPRRIK